MQRAGKSTFLNALAGISDPSKFIFEAKESMSSVTKSIKTVKIKFYKGRGEAELIDVPGFSDSDGKDQENIDSLFNTLKELETINKFILVIDKSSGISQAIWESLGLYKEMFGEFWEHLIVVITKLDYKHSKHKFPGAYKDYLKATEYEVYKMFRDRLKVKNLKAFGLSLEEVDPDEGRSKIWEEALNESLLEIITLCQQESHYETD